MSFETESQGRISTFADALEKLGEGKIDNLATLEQLLQARVHLEDYRVKVRQSDHVKQLLYGPVVISLASLVLALVLAVFSGIQAWQSRGAHDAERQRLQATLVLKVLEARSADDARRLLTFLEDVNLLTLPQYKREQLVGLLRQ